MYQSQTIPCRLCHMIAGMLAGITILLSSVAIAEDAANAADDRMDKVQVGQTLYVDDQLWITVRTSPNEQGERITVIPSGTHMTLQEHQQGDDYARVELSSGKSGWVLFRYLTDKPIAKELLDAAEQKMAKLQESNDSLQRSLSSTREERRTLEEKNRELEKQQEALNKELEDIRSISADAVDTFNEKRQLEMQSQTQQQEIDKLSKSADSLKSKLYLWSAISGIVCLLLGLYIGTIPIRREKRWQRMP